LNQFLPLQSQKIEELEDDNLSDIQLYIQGRVDEEIRGERSTPESPDNTSVIANLKPLQQRLEEADLTAEKLIKEVKDLSHGNFLYTKLLLNSIASGEQSIKNLAALPKTLNDIYHRILRYRCSFRGWLKRYQPILGTLSVTQEPISQEQLSKFIQIKSEDLAKDLAVFQQFLDESKDEQGQPLYTVFHQSLREYLLDRKYNHDFWCDAKEQHESIIQCFEDKSKQWQDLRAIDLYGLRHLAQHLVKGDQVEELHTLLWLEKDNNNAWFKVKDDKGETAGFLADVELAWSQVDYAYEHELGRSIGLQCRYALIKSTVISLADLIPPSLISALVKHNEYSEWNMTKIIAYTQQMSDPQIRYEGLMAIASELQGKGDPLKEYVLSSALKAARLVKDELSRAQALISLSIRLPEIVSEAIDAVETATLMKDKNEHSVFLSLKALADKLPSNLIPKTFSIYKHMSEYFRRDFLIFIGTKIPKKLLPTLLSEIDNSIKDKLFRIEILTNLSQQFSYKYLVLRALRETLIYIDSFQNNIQQDSKVSDYIVILISLNDKLPNNLLNKIIKICNKPNIRDYTPFFPAKVFLELSLKNPDVIPLAIDATKTFLLNDEYYNEFGLSEIAIKLKIALKTWYSGQTKESNDDNSHIVLEAEELLIQILNQAIKKASNSQFVFTNEDLTLRTSTALAIALTKDLLQQNIEIFHKAFQSIKDLNLLFELAHKLSDELLELVYETFYKSHSENFDKIILVFCKRVPNSSEILYLNALQFVKSYCRSEDERIEVLGLLIDYILPSFDKVPDRLLAQTVETINLLKSASDRTKLFSSLAFTTPHLLTYALSSALNISDETEQSLALIAISSSNSNFIREALNSIKVIKDENQRAKALTVISGQIPETLLQEALNIAKNITDESKYAHAVIAISKFPDMFSQVEEAMGILQKKHSIAVALEAGSSKIVCMTLDAFKAYLSYETEFYINFAAVTEDSVLSLVHRIPEFLITEAIETLHHTQNCLAKALGFIWLSDRVTEAHIHALKEISDIRDRLGPLSLECIYAGEALMRQIDRGQLNLSTNHIRKAIELSTKIFSDEGINKPSIPQYVVEKSYECLSLGAGFVYRSYLAKIIRQGNIFVFEQSNEVYLENSENEIPDLQTNIDDLTERQMVRLFKVQADILDEIIPNELIPNELLPEFLEQVKTFKNALSISEVLISSAESFPSLWKQALQSLPAILNESVRSKTLSTIAYKLPLDLLPNALEIAQTIDSTTERYRALNALASRIENALDSSKQFKDLLYFLAVRTRKNVLSDLAALIPVLNTLGGEMAVQETTQAIQNVARWWP
jgi:hypothetical protein